MISRGNPGAAHLCDRLARAHGISGLNQQRAAMSVHRIQPAPVADHHVIAHTAVIPRKRYGSVRRSHNRSPVIRSNSFMVAGRSRCRGQSLPIIARNSRACRTRPDKRAAAVRVNRNLTFPVSLRGLRRPSLLFFPFLLRLDLGNDILLRFDLRLHRVCIGLRVG